MPARFCDIFRPVPPTTTTLLAAVCASLVAFQSCAVGAEDDDRWALCPTDTWVPTRPVPAEPLAPGATEVRADEGQYIEGESSTFTGNVEVLREELALRAERLRVDPAADVIEFEGAARLWSAGVFWEGVRGQYAIERELGRLDGGSYQIIDGRGHGDAELILVDGQKKRSRLHGLDYTTCPGPVAAWRLEAASLTLDHEREWGRARHVRLKVKDVPVLYLPFMSFPLTDKRKSGFLTPSFGSSADSGVDVSIPYYWNIHPAYDATITPRVLGDRGVLLGGQFRYLLRDGEGRVDGEILPSDDLFDDRTRSLIDLQHYQRFGGGRGDLRVVFSHVSDKEYFEDFGNSLSVASTRFLPQQADLQYRGIGWYTRARVQNYQNVDRSLSGVSGPYKRLPQLFFSGVRGLRGTRWVGWLEADTTYFDREDSVTGARVDLRPAIGYQFYTPGVFVLPRLELRHTEYFLDGNDLGDDRIGRTVPVATLDARLILEREFELAGRRMLQTLEPRAYYVYIPETGQDDIPRFDTGRFDFSFGQLFRADRFSGRDRVGDTHQVSIGVETQILESGTGFERLRAGVGQIFFLEDREVTLVPGAPEETDDVSELVAEAVARITRAWSIRGAVQWDPNDSETQKAALRLRYRSESGPILNAEYRLRRAVTDIEQADLSMYWPVTRRWRVLGRWSYSLEDDATLETVGGIEYESCCWGVRAAARRFLSTATGRFDTGFFLQLELKGLAGVGRQTESFFRRTVPGYEPAF